MKVSSSRPIVPNARLTAAYARSDESATPSARSISDTTNVLGIPDAELTPKVQGAIQRLMEEVESLRRELEQSRQRIAYLEQLADQDALAPVANRRAFVRELSRIMAFAERYDSPSSLVYFDVNGLKPINDTHGHPAGDAALMRIADILVENVRESDVVGRLGGDEFAVILSQADEKTAAEKAKILVERVQAQPLDWNGSEIPLMVSYGIYTFNGGDTAGEALAAADRAMYENKMAHKKRVQDVSST
ncbi:MAG: GGDEF domain-containing protein [Rhodospirillaceae bacterium]|nr:GGDEF domain-containing protein [Rhodospirillaceae bacterium]|tara:strand:- start:9122 stop:9862 length:741 start_codon:yes stop_codon:yes gene_type:complete